jgi:FAD/FMN-containing dehydrogenase
MLGRATPHLAGWGGLSVPGREVRSEHLAEVARGRVLTRGLGRSYGDSALPPPGVTTVAGSVRADRILAFDPAGARLRAEAGLALGDLAWTLLPRGLFPPVVPGTQFVTLGGMVAADVHGKNHHVDGTIGRHVTALRLLTAAGEIVECSRERLPDLFHATVGGMGLTGHLLEVELALARIPSPWILQETRRVAHLDESLAALAESAREWPFTVCWLDALATGRALGRGVLIRGRWAAAAEAPAAAPVPLGGPAVPFHLPGFALNDLTVRLFNAIYRASFPARLRRGVVHPQKFFWPLDAVRHWNRIYGARGFTQFQCVLPERERPGAVRRFLSEAARRGGASFLCVLKDCGAEGEGLLSFPCPGVSVALDLPMRRGTRALVEELADAVLAEGGRIYLAKDAFVRADQFRAMEPRLESFARARDRWDPERRLRSAQSVRLLGDPA